MVIVLIDFVKGLNIFDFVMVSIIDLNCDLIFVVDLCVVRVGFVVLMSGYCIFVVVEVDYMWFIIIVCIVCLWFWYIRIC